jgi:ADP-heptose:LPS heptosyltransferase
MRIRPVWAVAFTSQAAHVRQKIRHQCFHGAERVLFVITAGDLEEAASIAESCPHLRYGGTVSLRRLAG